MTDQRDPTEGVAAIASLVLVVDDNAHFRELASRILQRWGHPVIEAGSVAEALLQVAARRPDVVVVDVGLPDGDGFELARCLAQGPDPRRVIVVSTDPEAAGGAAADRTGAVAFYPKEELLSEAFRQEVQGV